MRRRKLAFVLAFLMAVTSGGAAIAQEGPPESDPTCGAGQRQEDDCPGDNGGDNGEADEALCSLPGQADNDGTELAQDIILPGAENSCEE